MERLTPAARLFNANGMRTGRDGRLYVAQGVGSQVSAVDPDTGAVEAIIPKGSGISAPDDLAFDRHGAVYVTEVMDHQVTVTTPDGRTRVLRGDLPNVNGITFFGERLFVDECREGGRLLELHLDGGAPRVLLENLPLPNALSPGPDGMLYFPLLGDNAIWRISPEGGAAERVVGDLGVPDAVKFDAKGFIVSTQVGTGEVLRIDPQTGAREVMARLDPGLDNLEFAGERLFVSHLIDGRITEILGGGRTRQVLPSQFVGPLDLTVGDDGDLYIADGFSFWTLKPGGAQRSLSNAFDQTSPHGARGVANAGDGVFVVTTWDGKVARWRPAEQTYDLLAEGLDQPYGVAINAAGAVVVAEFGAGRVLSITGAGVQVLASDLDRPMGVTLDDNGDCYVSETGAGRVVKLVGAKVETVLDGLREPHGVLVRDGQLLVVDARSQSLTGLDLSSGARTILAQDLPVGAPAGVSLKPLPGVPWFCGPIGPFAGIAAGSDGTLYLSADAEGSVLALRRRD